MPVPKNARFAYKTIDRNDRQRLTFVGNKVIEVKGYHKRNGRWVENYTKRIR